MWNTITNGKIWRGEFLNKKKNNQLYWETATISPVMNSKGEIIHFIAVKTDITEKKESEEKFSQLAEQSPNMIFINQQGRVVYANKLCEEITGYTKEEFYSPDFDFRSLIDPEYIQPLMENFKMHMQGNDVPPFEYAIRTKQGERIETIINTKLVTYRNGPAILGVVTDISERKEAEAALRESEARLEAIISAATDAIITVDDNQRILMFNAAAEKVFGWQSDEIIGKHLGILLPENYREVHEQHVYNFGETGFTARAMGKMTELSGLRANGEIFPVEVMISKVNVSGRRLFTAILRDITERKKVEEALRKSEEKIRNIIEHSTNLFYSHTPDHVLTYLSPQVKSFLGFEPEEALVKWTEFITDNPVNIKGYEATQEVLKSGKAQPPYELELKCKDGTKIWVEAHEAPVVIDGKSIAVVGALTNITERKKAEEELKKSEAKWRSLTENSPDIVTLVDTDGKIQFINRTAPGLNKDDIIGSNAFEILPEEYREGARKCFESVLNTGKTESYNALYYTNEGEELFYQVVVGPVFREGKVVSVVSSARDITPLKTAEKRIRGSHTRLRNLAERLQMVREEERAAVAREIHDDLGQVLTVLKMDISSLSLLKNFEKDELKLKINRMLELVNSTIQTVKKIATNLRPGILDDLGLLPAIEWQAEEFQNRTKIACKVELQGFTKIIDDEISIAVFRIFQETLTNIARHSGATQTIVTLFCSDKELVLEVKDNGKGISDTQLNNPKSLGIIGMNERVNILRGDLNISGSPGKGTTVRVRIPLRDRSQL